MSSTDRGTERRRLLEAVRTDAESEGTVDDAGGRGSERPEPAPDGGTVTVTSTRYRCVACEATYPDRPLSCPDCGASSFVARTQE